MFSVTGTSVICWMRQKKLSRSKMDQDAVSWSEAAAQLPGTRGQAGQPGPVVIHHHQREFVALMDPVFCQREHFDLLMGDVEGIGLAAVEQTQL